MHNQAKCLSNISEKILTFVDASGFQLYEYAGLSVWQNLHDDGS